MSATLTSPRRAIADRNRAPARRAAPRHPPRRVSGPVGGRARTAAAPRESLALGGRALALVRGLPDHSLIDRLVRGRAWIPVLGVLLAGIVAMQVEILKLGSTMGRAMVRATALQTRNESLQASVAGLADDQRIERIAAGMGMTMPTPDSMVFLTARPGLGISRALGNIHAPDPTGFLSQLAAQAAAAAALMPPAPATSTTSTATTPSTSTATMAPSTGVTAAAPTSSATSQTAPTTQSAPPTQTPTQTPATQTPVQTAPTTSGAATTATGPATGAAGVGPAGPAQSSGG